MATDRPRREDSDDEIDDDVRDDAELDDELEDDRVRDDDYERDFGDTEPADPLGQAMPDVTEAHIAEAGGPVRKTSRAAPRARDAASTTRRPTARRKNIFGRAADFLRASYQELRRVQWPDRRRSVRAPR